MAGQRQVTSLRRLDSWAGLDDVELINLRPPSVAPLAAARKLSKLWSLGHPKIPEHVTLDLADLASLEDELRVTHGGRVRSLRPLATFTSPRECQGRSIVGGPSVVAGSQVRAGARGVL